MVRPGGFELPTFWFVARRSIQLSYGRTVAGKILSCRSDFFQNSSLFEKPHDLCASTDDYFMLILTVAVLDIPPDVAVTVTLEGPF